MRTISRLRASGSSIANHQILTQFKTKASNSFSAVQATFYSTKDLFERHKVVFTISTSIASVATAWAGYTLRHLHQSRVEERLQSIEKAMKSNYEMKEPEIRRLVSRTVSIPACVATAGTSLIIGYGLGWRGGAWYANRKLREEQMKLLGTIKQQRFHKVLKFLKRPLRRPKLQESAASKISDSSPKDASVPCT
ncbi:hypothetical protein ABFS83_08G115400 [Erythranthe nasuta]